MLSGILPPRSQGECKISSNLGRIVGSVCKRDLISNWASFVMGADSGKEYWLYLRESDERSSPRQHRRFTKLDKHQETRKQHGTTSLPRHKRLT